jgi:3alpha(or 20beta)-hydroxysteroid dehydrogenase
MASRLIGKVALVTGGASGMGASHARAIVAEGGQVVIGDLSEVAGKNLADELGDAARFVRLDVTSEEDWDNAVVFTLQSFGKLNVLINNAGVAAYDPLGSLTRAKWDFVLAVNLTGSFLGITAALDALRSAAPSSIINVSSGSAFQGQAGLHAYTASKWGLRGFTKSAAIELGSDGIRVNSVHPGVVRTPLVAGLELEGQYGPLGRIGEPEEVSNLIVYLASDESSYSTGAEFIVDGGLLAGPAKIPNT